MKARLFSIFALTLCLPMANSKATTFQQNSPTPFSQYGQIQNVQNYSSNPFWDPSSPYNQRMPVPVYVQGLDVGTSDCQAVVSALVASYCSSRNNCVGVDVDEARPTLTIQLASLPNHNYVTPCSGYIDSEFSKYVESAVAVPTGTTVPFPNATVPTNQNSDSQKVEFQNPYQRQLPTWNGDPWMQEMLERKQELENLQSSSGTNNDSTLAKADFPKTASDLSFTQRIQNDAAGYAPYENATGYVPLNIESEEKYRSRLSKNTKPESVTAAADKKYEKGTGVLGGELDSGQDNQECENATSMLAALKADLNTLKSCQNSKKKLVDCLASLRSDYFSTLETKNTQQLINYNYTNIGILIDSDCLIDPITKQKVCCNTATEDGDRIVSIGGFMYCGYEVRDKDGNISEVKPVYGMVRQCLQGKKKRSTTSSGVISGFFRRDFWDQNCITRFCEGEVAPKEGIENSINWDHNDDEICWTWDCPGNYIKMGNTCVSNSDLTEGMYSEEHFNYNYWIQTLNNKISEITAKCPNL